MLFLIDAMGSALEHDTASFLLLKMQGPQLLLSSFLDQESTFSSSPALWLLVGLLLHFLGGLVLLPQPPASVLSSESRLWKWQNTFMARIAAAITGLWAVAALYASPEMRSDLMLTSSTSAESLVAFSIGVHVAEAVDMVWHKQPSKLLVHHVFVILCFAGALLTGKAVGFAVLSLVT